MVKHSVSIILKNNSIPLTVKLDKDDASALMQIVMDGVKRWVNIAVWTEADKVGRTVYIDRREIVAVDVNWLPSD